MLNEVFDLFVELGATDDILDFPYVFASGREGYASDDSKARSGDVQPLLDKVLEFVPGPVVDPDSPLQVMVTTLEWSEYVGRIAIGRIVSGSVTTGQKIAVMKADGKPLNGEVTEVHLFDKLGRVKTESAEAGDIVALIGLPNPEIGDTVCDRFNQRALPRISVDEPTLSMLFTINDSPLAGKDGGKFLTSRHIRDRLDRELEHNVARVEEAGSKEKFLVSGRGILHLSVLIETMRREGYELSVGKPQVIIKIIDGQKHEPFETLTIDVPSAYVGAVMEPTCTRRGQLIDLTASDNGISHLTFSIPARGLIGLRTRLLNATKGEAVIHHRFDCFKLCEGEVPHRPNGVLISQENGKVVAFAMGKLQEPHRPVRQAERRGLRGHDRRRELARQRHGRQPDP